MAHFGADLNLGGGSLVQTPPANFKAVSKFTLDYDGVIDAIFIFYNILLAGNAKAVIYDSTELGGLPGAFIAQSLEVNNAASTGLAVKYSFSPGVSLSAGSYWIGIWSASQSTSSCQVLSSGIIYNANTYISGAPSNPFGTIPSSANFFYPIIARYRPILAKDTYSGELVGMDDTSLAQYPNNNIGVIQLDASYATGSSIDSITFFLAANYPSAKVKVVVYANDGPVGSPRTLLGASSEVVGQSLGKNTISFTSPITITDRPYIGLFTDTDLNTYRHVDAGRANYYGAASYGSAPSSFPNSPTSTSNQPPLWANGTFVLEEISRNPFRLRRRDNRRNRPQFTVSTVVKSVDALPDPPSINYYNIKRRALRPRYRNPSIAGTSLNQQLNIPRFTNSSTFFAPSVIDQIRPPNVVFKRKRFLSRHTNFSISAPDRSINTQVLSPSLFINNAAPLLLEDGSGNILLNQGGEILLYQNNIFYAPTVSPSGEVVLNPSHFVNNEQELLLESGGNILLNQGGVLLLNQNNIFYTPVISSSIQIILRPSRYIHFNTFRVATAVYDQLLHPSIFINSNHFYDPNSMERGIEPSSEKLLWVALEIDLRPQSTNEAIYTLRLGNRGPLQRIVHNVRYQYSPRLITDITIGTGISISTGSTATPFYQQPLRGQPNGGTISWIIDPNSPEWFGPGDTSIIGSTFRLYTGYTFDDGPTTGKDWSSDFSSDFGPIYISPDVDNNLTLVYTGHVVDFAIDITGRPPTATIQTTDASSDLDKSLVDDLYPSDFPIASLQGKPKPQLIGRKFSIEPILEDQVSLTYRVTRLDPGEIALGDVTQLTVGGIPWRRSYNAFFVNLSPSVENVNSQFATLLPQWKADFNSFVINEPQNYNNGNGLQNEVNLVALLNLYQRLSPTDKADFDAIVAANPSLYDDNGHPDAIYRKLGLIKNNYYSGLQGGEYSVDLVNGTVHLGSDPGNNDVRVDAHASDWERMDTAALITKICRMKGIAINKESMVQLHLDWPSLVGYYTGTEDVNLLNALDQITSGELCEWNLDTNGAVQAKIFDAPDMIPDLLLIAAQPNVPLDAYLLPAPGREARDPVPKLINTITQVGVLSPAYRARIGYASKANPSNSFLDGVTKEDQKNLSAPEMIADWISGGDVGYQLSPSDGQFVRARHPRAQDVYISSISNTLVDAYDLRLRLVQRIIGFRDHQIWSVTVRMEPTQVKLMSSVQMVWMDENGRDRIVYSGSFRVTSAIMVLGGGAQQLELWGTGTITSYTKPEPFIDILPGTLLSINFTPFEVKV